MATRTKGQKMTTIDKLLAAGNEADAHRASVAAVDDYMGYGPEPTYHLRRYSARGCKFIDCGQSNATADNDREAVEAMALAEILRGADADKHAAIMAGEFRWEIEESDLI